MPKRSALPIASLLTLALAAGPVLAEKGDRNQPMVFTADRQGRLDSVNQRLELIGNVIITQGTLMLRADRVDVRETKDGYRQAFASGGGGEAVRFRQSLDKPGESIEGMADQVEYDTRTESVRFIGNARVRSMRGSSVLDEVTGAVIVYNSRTEVFELEAGSASPNPSGRTRIVMMPRAPAAQDAASAPAPALPLQPSTTITPPRKPS